jgi:2-haloalkanoic acid dehalogenase type II
MIKLTLPLPDQIQVLTFDCYGTLIDWEAGIAGAFREAAARDGITLDSAQVLDKYHAIEAMVERGTYRPYRDVLAETARRVAAELGWSISKEQAAFLPRSLPNWPPFPDTGPALERLAARCRLGILSNVDEDLLEQTVLHFPVAFDFWVTADRVESYKPDLAHFEAARPFVGDSAGWLHVAQSLYHDVAPAQAMGLPVVWVNRKRESAHPEIRPAREVPDLAALADWLEA